MEESEARTEKDVEVKIQAVHRRIYAFELRMFESPQPGPTVDVSIFQTALAKIQADIDALPATASEPAREDVANDVVL